MNQLGGPLIMMIQTVWGFNPVNTKVSLDMKVFPSIPVVNTANEGRDL